MVKLFAPKAGRVFGDKEDDGDRGGCRLGRQRGRSAAHDNRNWMANQFGR